MYESVIVNRYSNIKFSLLVKRREQGFFYFFSLNFYSSKNSENRSLNINVYQIRRNYVRSM